MACLRGKHLVKVALQSQIIDQYRENIQQKVRQPTNMQSQTVCYRIQGSDVKIVDVPTNNFDVPGTTNEPDISC